MSRLFNQNYPCAPASPAHARRFCTSSLGEILSGYADMDGIIADAEMVVSELITNAVNAGGTSADLRISADHDRVRIEVADDGAGLPVQRNPGVTAGHGRGLMIVAALSADWGVLPEAAGKRVWAEFPMHHNSAC